MKRAKLSDFYSEEDKQFLIARYDPLFRAMAAQVKELEVTPEEFLSCMRYAVAANVYVHVFNGEEDYPTVLAMRLVIV